MTLAVCAFVILVQSLLAVLCLVYFKSELKQSISTQQFTMLTLVAQDIDQKLNSAHKELIAISREVTPAMVNDPVAAQSFLDHHPDARSIFDNALFLFSKEGRIIAESPFLENRRGRDISFREFYKRTVATGQPQISAPFISTHTPGTPSVMFTAPVRDKNGKLIAILGGGLNLLQDNFLGALSRTRIAKTGYLYLVTHDRLLIMHPEKQRIMKLVAQPGANRLLDRALNGFEGSGENINSQGLQALASFKHLQVTDWIIGANYPLAEAYEPIKRSQKYFIAAVIISSLLVIVVVRLIMERYTHTLVRFAAHVKNMATKQGRDRLFDHESRDEIGALVNTFNAMIKDEDRKSAELLHISTHDALTGLYNRAFFDAEIERMARGRTTPVSVVVADIDLLKDCNDTLGHAAGDILIMAAATSLVESFRAGDIVARTGGDEFCVLLPGVSAEQAEALLQRLKNSLDKAAPPVADFPLAVSFGCATASSPQELTEAFEQADQRMYREKRLKQAANALI